MEEINVEYLPIWRRYLEHVRFGGLTDKELGALVRAMMEYQFEGKEPESLSGGLRIFWAFFRADLDHARKRYETAVENGRKGGRKKQKKTERNPTKPGRRYINNRNNIRINDNIKPITRTIQGQGQIK